MAKYVPGWRFNPFDHELIQDYLKPVIVGKQLPCNFIKFRQVYGPSSNPWHVFDLNDDHSWFGSPDIKPTEKFMFVFAKLSKLSKSAASKNFSKRAGCGTWVGKTKRDRIRDGKGNVIGEKRYLVFEIKEIGSAAVGVGFDCRKVGFYKMHEYSLSGVNRGLDGADSIVLCKISYDSSKRCPIALMSGTKIADQNSRSNRVLCKKTTCDSSKECPITLMSGSKIADHASTSSSVLCTYDSFKELPITLQSAPKIADHFSTSTEVQGEEQNNNDKNLEGTGSVTTENPILIDDGVGDWNDAAQYDNGVGDWNDAAQYNNGVQELYDFSGGISFDDLGGEFPCFDDNLGGEDPYFGDLGCEGIYFDSMW